MTDGANTATLVECTVRSNAYLKSTITTTGTSTISAYLKAGTSGFGALYCNGALAEFDLTAGTFLLLEPLEIIVASVILLVICVVAPIWKYWLQGYKTTLRGPWDLAHISTS